MDQDSLMPTGTQHHLITLFHRDMKWRNLKNKHERLLTALYAR